MRFKNTKLEFPEDYFEPETRDGYEITTEVKKIWAIELDLYKELERVCQKNNLRLFATGGTLLGAVRHHDYIPWDDDMDLAMPREDYDKLVAIADKEFEHPYFFQTIYNDDHYLRGHAQFRNSMTTGALPIDKGMPYNKGIFIDVFPLDHLPDRPIQVKILRIRALFWWALLLLSYYNPTIMDHRPYAKYLCAIMKPFYKLVDYRKVYRRYEKICMSYNNKRTRKKSYFCGFQVSNLDLFDLDTYYSGKKMKFGFTDIMVPDGYKKILRAIYGPDYMTPMQSFANMHGDTILDPEKSYKEYDNI